MTLNEENHVRPI